MACGGDGAGDAGGGGGGGGGGPPGDSLGYGKCSTHMCVFFIAAIDGGLLFGEGSMYSAEPNRPSELRREKCRSDLNELLRMKKRKYKCNASSPEGKRCTLGRDCEESLVLQYLKLQLEPQVGYCFSRWHSGLGSLCWGSHFLQKVDLTCIQRAMIEEPDAQPNDCIEYEHRFHIPPGMKLRDFIASSASTTMPLWRRQQLAYNGTTMAPFQDLRHPLQAYERRQDELMVQANHVWPDEVENEEEEGNVLPPRVPEFDTNGWGRVPGVPTNRQGENGEWQQLQQPPRVEYTSFFEPAYMTKITLIQYHGCFWHNGGHYSRCIHFKEEQQQKKSAAIEARRDYSRYLDILKLYYGAFMQEAAQVWIENRIVYSCDIICFPGSFPISWNELEARSKMKHHHFGFDLQPEENIVLHSSVPHQEAAGANVQSAGESKKRGERGKKLESLREFLRRKFYHETCLGFTHSKAGNDVGDCIGGQVVRVQDFKDWIATSPYTSCGISSLEHVHPREKQRSNEKNDLGGFVTIIGGKMNNVDNFFGFCHQRAISNLQHLGDFSKYQLELMDVKQQNFLKKAMQNEAKTMTRLQFSETEPEVLNMDYLRYLVQEHGLHDYKVVHIYLFRAQAHLNDFLVSLLKQRAACKNASPILSHSLKLCINR